MAANYRRLARKYALKLVTNRRWTYHNFVVLTLFISVALLILLICILVCVRVKPVVIYHPLNCTVDNVGLWLRRSCYSRFHFSRISNAKTRSFQVGNSHNRQYCKYNLSLYARNPRMKSPLHVTPLVTVVAMQLFRLIFFLSGRQRGEIPPPAWLLHNLT